MIQDDPVFFLSICTLFVGSISTCLIYLFKSECKNLTFYYGCKAIERDIELEVIDPLNDTENHVNPEV